ncbi:MAG: non-canonical purine NTP pyrophosphatase [Bdellovibrionales bacterium]|nr:non-canonical purine NTP pyrophosphatase [Bdellovibrionales bacterium]
MNVIALASLNRGKLEEFQALFSRHNVRLVGFDSFVRNAGHLGKVESRLPSATYGENSRRKCVAAFSAAKVPTVADDSGLEVDALNGEPGVHSAQSSPRKILDALKGKQNRKARMRCVLTFLMEGLAVTAEGVVEGRIADRETGTGGFGYDAIFIPEAGDGRTFAQMLPEEKNALSHRAKAVDALAGKIQDFELVRP